MGCRFLTDQVKRLGYGTALRRETGKILYTVPNATSAIIRRITLSNKGVGTPGYGGYGIAIARVVLGSANETFMEVKLNAFDHVVLEPNLLMAAGDTIGIREIVEMNGSPDLAMTSNTTGSSATDTTAYTTASWTSVAGGIYILTVASSKASAPDVVSSISADATHGASWVSIRTEKNVADNLRITTYRTKTTQAASGTTTINFGGTQTGAAWNISQVVGGSTVGDNGEEAIQESGARFMVPAITNLWVPAFPWSGAAYACVAQGAIAVTNVPGHGTELVDTNNAESIALHTWYDPTPRSVAWSTASGTPTAPVGMVHNLQDARASQVLGLVEGVEIT